MDQRWVRPYRSAHRRVFYLGQPEPTRPTPTPGPIAKDVDQLLKESPITLTAWQSMSSVLYGSADDKKRRFNDYIGQRVTWQGYVEHWVELRDNPTPVNALMLVMYDSRMTLNEAKEAMAARDRLSPPFVRCFFPETADKQLAKVKPGQQVVIRGTLADPLLTGHSLCTDLRQCEILFVEEEHIASIPGGAAPR